MPTVKVRMGGSTRTAWPYGRDGQLGRPDAGTGRPSAAPSAPRSLERLEGVVFTGIVEELGEVAGLDRLVGSARLTIRGPVVAASARPGSSIAVSGVCLTVTQAEGGVFSADVMGETLARTSLGGLGPGGTVNLERPVPAAGRLDGHIVQGHVDGTGTIASSRAEDNWRVLRVSVSPGLSRYLAEKGSVAVDGVSLTVSAVSATDGDGHGGGWFEVSLIPETLARTTLGSLGAADIVNIEVDVIAKYVERLLAGTPANGGGR